MKTQIRIRGFNVHATWQSLVVKQLQRLKSLTNVESADVLLEHQRDAAPSFRAFVHLLVPGSDIHADARAHTVEAVWLKVTKNLRQQIERRKGRQQSKLKSNRQHPVTPSRGSGAGVAGRI